MRLGIILATISLFCMTSSAVDTTERAKVLNEIRSTFGMVPTFLREFPAEGLPGAWEDFKAVQLSTSTALDGKTKELIGLAVASAIPCRYCTYFHRKAAAMNGAKPEEIKLAIALAGMEVKWGTYFEGTQRDLGKFKSEIDKITSFTKVGTAPQTETMAMRPMDAKAAYKDIENSFGFVPDFLKAYPEAGIAGAWNEHKDLYMNRATALPVKIKDLIALGVSSQIPNQHNIYADTEAAKRNGATSQEINEAVAVASHVRHWSTVLNGLRQDEKAFEREVDQMINYIQKSKGITPKKVSQNQ